MFSHYRILVSGRVQGVGFRYFVLNIAQALQVNGFVRNLEDGDVEIFAALEHDKLDDFANQIWLGSPMSKVIDVQVIETSAFEAKGFKVK